MENAETEDFFFSDGKMMEKYIKKPEKDGGKLEKYFHQCIITRKDIST